MSIRVYIVTYKRNDVLNKNLKTLWATACAPEKLDVTVLANHPDVQIDYENQRPNLRVKLNETRPTNAWGYLSRDWNYGLLDAFGTWENPRGTDWAVLAQNDVEWIEGWDNFLRNEDRFDFITQAAGDQSMAFTINAVRKVGFFDERLNTLHFHEFDYFLRAILALLDRASINDNHGSLRPGEACEPCWNGIGQVLTHVTATGINEKDNLHTFRTWKEMRNLLLHKWNVSDLTLLTDRPRFAVHASRTQMPQQEVDWYPFFWDKMPGRPHQLLNQYADWQDPPPPKLKVRLPLWRKWPRKLSSFLLRKSDRLISRWATPKPIVPGPKPQISHPLNQPPGFAAAAELRISPISAPERSHDNSNQILAVLQGPIFRRVNSPSTFEAIERMRTNPFGPRITVAAALWDTELPADLRQVERIVDHLHVLTPPQRKGNSNRNWQSFAVDAVLDAHQHDGYRFALKTRTDMLLSDRYFEHIFQRMNEDTDRLCVTNLVTRYEPFHLSDMNVFAKYANLRHYFGNYELFYEDAFSPEVEFARSYVRSRGLNYHHTQEDYLAFLRDQVDMVDFEEMGLLWLKFPELTSAVACNARVVLMDRDCGPWQGRQITTRFHQKLLKMNDRQIRKYALLMQLIDPVLRMVLRRNDYLPHIPYHVCDQAEIWRVPAKLPIESNSAGRKPATPTWRKAA